MFFTRIAIAALTFGSFAQVFAAPIAKDLGAAIPESLPVERRTVDYTSAITDTKAVLEGVKNQIIAAAPLDPTKVTPEFLESFAQVPLALASISSAMKDTGAEDLAKVSTDSIAAEMAEVLTTTNDIVGSVEKIKTLQSIIVITENIKAELGTVEGIVLALVPKVLVIIKGILEVVHATLATIIPTIKVVVDDVATGGI